NLSNVLIPREVKALLQLGENFCLPIFNINNTIIDFVKHIEHNFFRLKLPRHHSETYEIVTHNPVNRVLTRLKTLLKGWKQRGLVEKKFGIYHGYFTIPFIPFLSEKIKKFFKKDSLIRMAYKGINNLKGFIKGHKDFRSKFSHTDVVYKIECQDCDASYVGQTGRCLKTRINEHRNHINWNTTQHSVITEHRISHQHEFDWENIKIIDKERVLNKRLISEMIHIKKQRQSLNLQNDTYTLNPLYLELLMES
ncbi:hypothetical protein ALC57_12529, partial [Trachymyrmex cornetzi]